MRCLRIPLALSLALLSLVAVALPATDPAKVTPAEIDRLIQQLGSTKFEDREAASRKLDAIGAPALPALRNVMKSGDTEVRRRAYEIMKAIEQRSISAAALAPTKVHLKANKTPLAKVIRDLAQQSKIRLFLAREPVDLGERLVTLDTGETSFFEALDALCRQAKVHLRPEFQEFSPSVTPAPPNVPGMIAPDGVPQEYPLVLQDGLLPEQPIAYLGGIRLRLLPDRSQAAKGTVRGGRWFVEVLSEPRLDWRGPLFLHWEDARGVKGERIGSLPVVVEAGKNRGNGGNAARAAGIGMVFQIQGMGFNIGEDVRDTRQSVLRREIPVKWELSDKTDIKLATLQGRLKGVMLMPPAAVVSIAEVLKAGSEPIKGKDGYKLTVQECTRKDDGTVEMDVEVESPAHLGGNGQAQIGIIFQIQAPAGGAPLKGNESGFHVWDTKGRPYSVSGKVSQGRENVKTYHLTLKPAAKDSQPGKLEFHALYTAGIEPSFTFHNVRLP